MRYQHPEEFDRGYILPEPVPVYREPLPEGFNTEGEVPVEEGV